jgi:VCBS repeat-containing protein
LKLNADGSFNYDPSTSKSLNGLSQGQTGKDSFAYTIRDPNGATSTATVSLTITGVNDAPVATNDAFTTTEDIALTTDNLMKNDNGSGIDTDPDLADTLVVSAINGIAGNVGKTISLKSGSSLRVNLDGSFVYDPTVSIQWQSLPAGQVGSETFTYSISDNKGGSSTATVTVTVGGVNDVPVATANNYATNEDTATSGNVMSDNTGKGVDSDIDSQDVISVSAVDGNPVFAAGDTTITLASGATLLINASGNFTYNPGTSALLQGLRQGESTTDSFVYTIKDLQNASASATVTLAISGLNDAPVARNNSYSVDENSVLSKNMRTDAPADTDADVGDTMTVVDVNGVPVPSTGLKLTLPLGASLNVAQSGAFTYDPRAALVFDQLAPGQSRGDSFTYTIRDALGATPKATVAIDVTGVNDAPRLTDDFFTVDQGTTTALTVLANDSDVDGTISASTVAIKTTPSSGKATVNANGTITYVADSTTVGDVKLTYTVKDNLGAESNPATVTITVRPAPSPWQNQSNALDVNASGFVEPIDALLVINRINRVGSGPVPSPATPPPFYDVDGNRFIAPADAILVINFLNSLAPGGEGEAVQTVDGVEADGMGLARQMESVGVFVANVDQRWTMEPVVTARVWTAEDEQRRAADTLWSLPAILEPSTSRAQRVEGAISQLVKDQTDAIWQQLAGRKRDQLIDDLFGADGDSW